MTINLRELVFYDRNPESMRTVPRVCAAGGDSIRGVRFFSPFFRKIGPGGKNGWKSNVLGTWRPLLWRPKFF